MRLSLMFGIPLWIVIGVLGFAAYWFLIRPKASSA